MSLFKDIDFYSLRRTIPHMYIDKMKYYEFYYLFEDEKKRYEKELEESEQNDIEVEKMRNDVSSIPNTINTDIGELATYK